MTLNNKIKLELNSKIQNSDFYTYYSWLGSIINPISLPLNIITKNKIERVKFSMFLHKNILMIDGLPE